MAGPVYDTSTTFNTNSSGSPASPLPVAGWATAPAVGDALLMSIAGNFSAGAFTASCPGWTTVLSVNGLILLSKPATGSEPNSLASYSVTVTTTLSNLITGVVAYSSCAGVDASASTAYTSNTTAYVAPASSATTSSDMQLSIFAGRGNATSGVTFTVPSGMTSRVAAPGTGTAKPGLAITEQALSSSGATATKSSTASVSTPGSAVTILLTQALAPAAPTLTAPAPGAYVDATGVITFTGTYNSTDGGNQNAYAFRIKTSAGSYQYWNSTSGALQATIVWNTITTTPGSAFSLALPANILTNGNTYNWSLASQEAYSSLQGPFAADQTITTQAGPTCTVTAPTGTVSASSAPAITWTETLGGSAVQTSYRAVIESGAYSTVPGSGTSVWDSGVVASAALTATPPSLANSTTYRVFVQVTETGGMTSAWSYSTFTISLTPPATPTLVVTADHDGTTGCPRASIAVTGHDTGAFTYADTTFEVQCSYNGGAWIDVRGASAVAPNSSDQATVYDYETPLGGVQSYRARTAGTAGGQPIVGAWSTTATVTLPDNACWLTDPTNPATAVGLPVRSDMTRKRPITQDVIVTLGSTQPIVSSDVRQVEQGTLVWKTADAADRAALEVLLDLGSTLLQRLPAELIDAGPAWYFRPTGDVTTARYADGSPLSQRDVTTTWVGRNRP